MCSPKVLTQVKSTVSSSGWCWCMCCCLFGAGLITAILALFLPGFKRFKHTCPYCKYVLCHSPHFFHISYNFRNDFGIFEPEMTGSQKLLLLVVTLLSLGIGTMWILYNYGTFD